MVSVLLYYYFALKVFSKIQKDFLLAEVVAEEENAVVQVGSHNIHQSLVGFFTAWKVILWVRKCVIKVKVVNINSNAMEVWVASADRTKPLIIEHSLTKAEIARVQNCPHLAFKEEHHCTWAVKSVHKHDLDSIVFVFVQVNPVLFVHLKIYNKVAKPWKALQNKTLAEMTHVDLAMVPLVGQSAQVVFVAMREKVAVACFVLLPVLKVVYADV